MRAWIAGVEFSLAGAHAPAMAGTVDQNHPMGFGEHIAERQPHGLEIGACTMDHDDRRHGGIARTDIDDVQGRPGDIDRLPLRRMGALQDNDTGLGDQGENDQRRHDNDQYHLQCLDHLGHN